MKLSDELTLNSKSNKFESDPSNEENCPKPINKSLLNLLLLNGEYKLTKYTDQLFLESKAQKFCEAYKNTSELVELYFKK